MNLPNKLTMLRVLLIPVFMVCAANRWMLAAGIIFAAASLTDYFDGHLARKNNLVTDFGKFADPLADKLLTTTAFLYMLVDGVCDPVVLAIILAREFAVSGLRMVAAGAPGGKVIAASQAGKYKTLCQCIGLAMLMLPMWSLAPEGVNDTPMWMTVYYTITYALIYFALILCLYSGGEYLVNTFGGRKKSAGKSGKETK